MIRRVMVVDDDVAVREALAQTLELAELKPRAVGSFIEAKDHISAGFEGVIVSDIRMPGRDGFHLLEYTQGVDAELPVILLTGEGDIPMAVKAMGQGAFGFLEKPCAPADLLAVVEQALKNRALVLENRRLKAQLEAGDPAARLLFGASAVSEGLRARVRIVAQARAEVLVMGAPGSGISKVAEVIHLMSPVAKGPFVKRPAAGLDRAAFEAACEAAAGGSLFLDELSNMPTETQFAALERIERGMTARVIGGTTSDLRAAAQDGHFNPDLFYRLDVMRVRIPSLAERPDDIPVMFRQYVAQASEQAGLTPPEVTPDVVAGLMAQDWPGNARALMSAAMRFALGLGAGEGEADSPGADLGLAEQMARVERSLLIAALRRELGHASEAAKALKLPRKTFYDKLARYGIKPEEFR
ncbi:sigma-54-dependent transcriptional regulator [Thalassovita taeanensis]|uniref:Two-component system, NtrC family, C4-dicarboxylate transport response regulator DctD n=1 Tax=Thalassovita taeanensis TaxID=657014 RepID=A0A1H9KTH8_9RHOB|nr:sigma-54 dependent transcriptional regulator [Thalassovita taeanensis]SER02339.1 two-component system, NtrC family, C4-dicarboxylate transport response regulator DctD [Thalassovita taeanensis]